MTLLKDRGLRITVTLAPGIVKDRGGMPGHLPARATLDAAVLGKREIKIRSVRAGDRIAPFGMRGSRKLQDILVDAKVPREDRARIPVLECDGEVVWLPGYRIARQWAVDDEDARNVQIAIALG